MCHKGALSACGKGMPLSALHKGNANICKRQHIQIGNMYAWECKHEMHARILGVCVSDEKCMQNDMCIGG